MTSNVRDMNVCQLLSSFILTFHTDVVFLFVCLVSFKVGMGCIDNIPMRAMNMDS